MLCVDLITQLSSEHQDYVVNLSVLAEVIEGIRVNGRGDYFIATLDRLFEPLTIDLDDHARREEDILFPKLLERAPDSPIAVMLEDHQIIRALSARFGRWYPIWRGGADEVFGNWAEPAENLRGKFSAHMQKENLILFPLARRVLTDGEIRQLTMIPEQ